MRGSLAVSMFALLAASGCASRGDLRALQMPAQAPQGMVRFDDAHQFRDAVVLEWIGGVSQRSYLFAEPNQNMMRPIVERALRDAGLAAGTNVCARYGLRVDVSAVHGSEAGGNFNAEIASTYILVDRATGAEVWRREVRTPGRGYFLAFNEHDWQTAWFLDPILALTDVGQPMNFFAFASDSSAARARLEGESDAQASLHQVMPANATADGALRDRWGPAQSARANYAAVSANVSKFLLAFAADNDVEVIPILPCWGSPEVEARKREIMASGGSFTTDDCHIAR